MLTLSLSWPFAAMFLLGIAALAVLSRKWSQRMDDEHAAYHALGFRKPEPWEKDDDAR